MVNLTHNSISTEFYRQDAIHVAQQLIGQILVRELENEVRISRIIETEAYFGEQDSACHASKGRTPRTEVMYQAGGLAYIYLIYGMYHMLNIVTGTAEHPQAVLIRAIEPLQLAPHQGASNLAFVDCPTPPKSKRLSNGPGKLCRYLGIDRSLNAWDLSRTERLWLLAQSNADLVVESGPRIGIDYAQEKDKKRPWRFWLQDNPYVSR